MTARQGLSKDPTNDCCRGCREGGREGGRDLLMYTHPFRVPYLLCSTPGYSPRLLP